MEPKTAADYILEIVTLPALHELIAAFCNTSSIGLTFCDLEGATILSHRNQNKRFYSCVMENRDFRAELSSLISTSELLSPSLLRVPHYDGIHMVGLRLASGRKTLAVALLGPFFLEKVTRSSLVDFVSQLGLSREQIKEMEEEIPVLMKKEVASRRRMLNACAQVIVQFYNEKHHSRQYISRMSSLYNISATINSTIRLEEVLRLVLDSAIGLLGAQAGSIMLLDEKAGEMRILVANGLSEEIIKKARVKIGEGISGTVAQKGKPRLMLKGVRESSSFADRKKEEIKSAICVPLKAKGHVIGVLNVSGKEDNDNFTSEDVGLLEIMASSAAVAIYNANLYTSLQGKARELEALYGIGTTITSSMHRKKVLAEVLRSARKLLRAKKGSLMLLNKETGELRIEIAYGLPPKIKKTARHRLGEGIAGKVALEGKPRLMLKGIKVTESKSEMAETEIPSAISVPVKVKDNTIGVLNVSDRESGDNFTGESVDLLMMLANQAAIAIENSRLLEELQELFVESITALANAIDARDPYTRGHSQRVTEYSLRIAKRMNLPGEEIEYIQYAALLHDIGKINIRDDILHKPGKLTDDEFEEMQKHPVYGVKIMEPVKRFKTILPYMYHHHEKYSGKGYPLHLAGEDIPLAARIISVADSFDAMTSDRPYRKGFSAEEAVVELKRCSGTQFDPAIVEVFLEVLAQEKGNWLQGLIKQTS